MISLAYAGALVRGIRCRVMRHIMGTGARHRIPGMTVAQLGALIVVLAINILLGGMLLEAVDAGALGGSALGAFVLAVVDVLLVTRILRARH
jgi:hypothetical protein